MFVQSLALVLHLAVLVCQSTGANNVTTMAEAQLSINCQAFLQPIRERRQKCLDTSGETELDICVYFASDYEFIIPFIAHHLSLGAKRIFIYNNDEQVAWYRHPTILCLLAEQYIHIQPWFGEGVLMRGLNHCYRKTIPMSHGLNFEQSHKELSTIWGANLDIDEMVVLHKHQCLTHLLKTVEAPTLALNWAFFVPEYPLNDFTTTGNLAFMPKRDYDLHGVVLPHDKLQRRMYENQHIKSINRVACVEAWHNEHCPGYRDSCPFGKNPKDPENHTLACQSWTPWIDNYYPTAQLNHYWTLSLADFLRKIHRGKGGSYSKRDGEAYRNTAEFFSHATPSRVPFVNDTSLIDRYGSFYAELKRRCPKCFDVSYYYLKD